MGGISWGALTHVTKVHSKRTLRAIQAGIYPEPNPMPYATGSRVSRAYNHLIFLSSHVPISQVYDPIK